MSDVSLWVRRWAGIVPDGEVLDLACGGGRHARHFAALGHPVLALDRDAEALKEAAGQGITTCQFDLESRMAPWPFAQQRFAGIVVTNYLHRPLFDQLLDSLAENGVLIYETFAQGNETLGKPSNPDFLLVEAELLWFAAMHDLRVLAFEQGYTDEPKPAMVQRLCACKPGFTPEKARLGFPAQPFDTRN